MSLQEIWQELLSLLHPAPPSFTEYPLTGEEVGGLCAGAKDHVYVWDNRYWCVSMEDWKRIFDDVRSNLPSYVPEKFDCEDFAVSVTARIIERYKLNTCAFVCGQSPMGYHGFNLFIAKEGNAFKLHVLEPQNGQVDPEGYIPETVIFS